MGGWWRVADKCVHMHKDVPSLSFPFPVCMSFVREIQNVIISIISRARLVAMCINLDLNTASQGPKPSRAFPYAIQISPAVPGFENSHTLPQRLCNHKLCDFF